MARPATGMNLSISQLENVLRARKRQLQKLAKKRAKIARELARLDLRIHALGGDGGTNGGGRARNAQSLVATLEGVLKSGKPMGVGDIVDAVQKGGYKSNSANFRGIVNQTLIKEKQFAQAGRGVYQLKK